MRQYGWYRGCWPRAPHGGSVFGYPDARRGGPGTAAVASWSCVEPLPCPTVPTRFVRRFIRGHFRNAAQTRSAIRVLTALAAASMPGGSRHRPACRSGAARQPGPRSRSRKMETWNKFSTSPSTTLRRTARINLPERVLGSVMAKWIASGVDRTDLRAKRSCCRARLLAWRMAESERDTSIDALLLGMRLARRRRATPAASRARREAPTASQPRSTR